MDAQIAALENAAGSLAALAADIAGLQSGFPPDTGRVRDLLTMCEEDLLSAADALHKTLTAVGSSYAPPAAGLPVAPPPEPSGLPAARTRVPARRRDRVVAGQGVLFALPDTGALLQTSKAS